MIENLHITDFTFYRYDRSNGSDYAFEMQLEDEEPLEAQIEFKVIGGMEYIDYIEVASSHILADDEVEMIEEILQENIADIFRIAEQVI